MILFSGKKRRTNSFKVFGKSKIRIATIAGKTTNVKLECDAGTITGVASSNLYGGGQLYDAAFSDGVNRVNTITIDDTSLIKVIMFQDKSGSFPVLIGYSNLDELYISNSSSLVADLTSPYLDQLKLSLKTWTQQYVTINTPPFTANDSFWYNCLSLTRFTLNQVYDSGYSQLGWLASLPALKTVEILSFIGATKPTTVPLVFSSLNQVETINLLGYSDVLEVNVFEKIEALTSLKSLNLQSNYKTTARVDDLINNIYARCIALNKTNLTINVSTYAVPRVAVPTGTYDGTTDWVGGVPTSPKAKIWHLVNTKGHTWLYDV